MGTVSAIVPALWWVIAAMRRGRVGVDVIALLSLVGAMAVGEYLAGALIGLMLATGQVLEAAAERRATKDLRALLDRVPHTARLRSADGVEVVGLDTIVARDAAKAQQGVAEVLTDPINGYGAQQVSQVRCNNGQNPTIVAGRSFTCQAVIDGNPYDVTVTFKGDDGTYEVDWPR